MLSNDISTTSKLGQCQICKEEIAKYKCPRCELCTCSLVCVSTHKTHNKCSGARDRVGMIPRREMNNFTLLSDYRFLEEIDHKLDDVNRNPHRRAIYKGRECFPDLPIHLRKLKIAGRKRGTFIDFMPKHFSMHRGNTTRFMISENKIRWHIKWVFPQCDATFTDEKVDENCLLIDLLRKYMEPTCSLEGDETSPLSSEDSEKLCYYHSASYRRIAVLLQSSLCYRDRRYTEMFLSKSLRVNFANRKIVEYPIFYVVLRDHLDAYLDSDQSDDEDLTSHNNSDKLESQDSSRRKDRFTQETIIKTTTRVSKRDGGLNFFDAFSDSDDADHT